MENQPSFVMYGVLAIATLVYVWRWLMPSKHQLADIPAMGPTAPLLSYWGALQWMLKGSEIAREGYQKYKGRAFKVATFSRWIVVVSGPQLVEELRKAPDDELSFVDAANDTLEINYTAGPNIATNMYHVPLVRSQLTRSLYVLFPEIRDEVETACDEQIPSSSDWVSVVGFDMVMQVVARTSNRIFIGLPFCRDPDFIKLSINFTISLVVAATTINQFPNFLKPIMGPLLSRGPASIEQAMKCIGKEVERRLQLVEKYGPDYSEKPCDMLSWLIDHAEGEERSVRNLVLRLLVLGFAAIHTSTMAFTHALYHAAAQPEYVKILRQDIETVAKAEGWSKNSIDKMHKVDSFLKECQRMYSTGSISMMRRAMKDFTFSDGTFIPEGSFVGTAVLGMQHDSDFYEDGDIFNPWRFSDAREREGDSGKHAFVSTSIEYHTFGHGRHACPGRFFAANELKMLMVHLVMTYDMKLEKDGVIPPPFVLGTAITPNRTAKVFFRKRQS